jgi:hypothetical protein
MPVPRVQISRDRALQESHLMKTSRSPMFGAAFETSPLVGPLFAFESEAFGFDSLFPVFGCADVACAASVRSVLSHSRHGDFTHFASNCGCTGLRANFVGAKGASAWVWNLMLRGPLDKVQAEWLSKDHLVSAAAISGSATRHSMEHRSISRGSPVGLVSRRAEMFSGIQTLTSLQQTSQSRVSIFIWSAPPARPSASAWD